jgi:hypothetical protein
MCMCVRRDRRAEVVRVVRRVLLELHHKRSTKGVNMATIESTIARKVVIETVPRGREKRARVVCWVF